MTLPKEIDAVFGVLATVLGMIAYDPFGFVAVIWATIWAQAGTLFTASTVGSFLADQIPALPQGALQAAALVFGGIFLLTLLDKFWDGFKGRLDR